VASGPAGLDALSTVAPAAGEVGTLPSGHSAILYVARPATHLPMVQPFYFQPGIQVFASDGGGVQTQSVHGYDVTTVDAHHRQTVHSAGFFEARDGSRYDRAAVASLWPLRIGKQVKFAETTRDGRWSHTIRILRGERIVLPPGWFDTFVVEWTATDMKRPTASITKTYWYAPAVGAIVRSEVRSSGDKPLIQEAAILGRPIGGIDGGLTAGASISEAAGGSVPPRQ